MNDWVNGAALLFLAAALLWCGPANLRRSLRGGRLLTILFDIGSILGGVAAFYVGTLFILDAMASSY